MHIDRRQFVGASGALALGGCATTGNFPSRVAACSPLVPVVVDPAQVIRTVAGLRPFRPRGFRVEREALGDKALVHNYGHGGGGITMSWGSARLATDLALPGHSGRVAVIGAGVVGLSTARLVQEAGFDVIVYARDMPPHTTSNVAGGQFHPYAVYRKALATPAFEEQYRRALDYGWRRFQIMVGEEYGIRWLPTYAENDSIEVPVIPNYPPVNRMLSAAEHPFPVATMRRYDTLYVETGRYLFQLLRDIRIAGGRVVQRAFATPADLAALPERTIINCTGLGSRDLFGDAEMQPIRGQLAILQPQPAINYAVNSKAGYMFPRPDGIVLGGTFERDVFDPTPQPAAIAEILASNKAFFDAFRCTA